MNGKVYEIEGGLKCFIGGDVDCQLSLATDQYRFVLGPSGQVKHFVIFSLLNTLFEGVRLLMTTFSYSLYFM